MSEDPHEDHQLIADIIELLTWLIWWEEAPNWLGISFIIAVICTYRYFMH